MISNRITIFATLCAFLLTAVRLQAQQFEPPNFGEVSKEEREMKRCLFDTTAKAVVLFDLGTTKFIRSEYGFNIKTIRRKRVKVLDPSLDEVAFVEIPFYTDGYNKEERVMSLKAYTYNFDANGAIIQQEVRKQDVFEEEMRDHWHRKKFTFPNVQEGSILEYEYEFFSPFMFNLTDWEFQSSIPTLYSEYQVSMVPFYEYVVRIQGVDSLDVQLSEKSKGDYNDFGIKYQLLTHTYGLRNIPAFDDESFITSKNDFIIKADFQLAKKYYPDGRQEEIISSWEELNKELLTHDRFGKYMKSCRKYAKQALEDELNLAGLTQRQQAEKLIDYVKGRFYWNYYYGKYASQTPKELITSQKGAVPDINLFLIALMREAGLNAHPVILSTRGNGKLRINYPFDKATNYVVAFVEIDQPFLADATLPKLSYDLLPSDCINEYGLVVEKVDEVRWLTINNQQASSREYRATIDIEPDEETLTAKLFINSKRYEAHEYRSDFENSTKGISQHFSKSLEDIDSVQTKNYDDTTKPYVLYIEGHQPVEVIGDLMFIDPFMNLVEKSNPLKKATRNYPVDFIYPSRKSLFVQLNIPEGYAPEALPENTFVNNSLMFVSSKYAYNEAMNQVSAVCIFEYKKAVYQAEEYAELKTTIDKIAAIFNENITLKAL